MNKLAQVTAAAESLGFKVTQATLSYVSLTIEYIFIHTGEPTGYQENGIPTFVPKDLLVGCTNDDTGLRQAASILAAKGATIE